MPVNSISPSQAAQFMQAAKKSEATAARKKSEIQDANQMNDRKVSAERQAQIQKSQLQQTQEAAKPVVNSNGQTTGTRINTSA